MMDYFIKKRFSFWLVFFLLVLNIATISTILYHIYSDNTSASSAAENIGAGKIITSELKLNEQQKDMFSVINNSYNKKSKPILDQLTEKRSEMLAELSETNPDTAILKTISIEIGELHTALKILTIDNFLDLKKICTEDQQQQLSEMYRICCKVKDILKAMENNTGTGIVTVRAEVMDGRKTIKFAEKTA